MENASYIYLKMDFLKRCSKYYKYTAFRLQKNAN